MNFKIYLSKNIINHKIKVTMKKAIINKGMMKMDKEKMDTFFEGLIAIIFKEMLEMILPL